MLIHIDSNIFFYCFLVLPPAKCNFNGGEFRSNSNPVIKRFQSFQSPAITPVYTATISKAYDEDIMWRKNKWGRI